MMSENLEKEIIDVLGNAYGIAKDIFDIDPINANSLTQKEIRKWLCKNYPVYEWFPFLNKKSTDEQVIGLVSQIYETMEQKNKSFKRFTDDFAASFSGDITDALKELAEGYCDGDAFKTAGEDVKIYYRCCPSYLKCITFHNCTMPDLPAFSSVDFSGTVFSKAEGVYSAPALIENCEDDTQHPFVFKFENVSVYIKPLNATAEVSFLEDGWAVLYCIASSLVNKAQESKALLNEQEEKLLPLLNEIVSLDLLSAYDPQGIKTFPLLKSYAEKYNATQLVECIESFEDCLLRGAKPNKSILKFTAEFRKIENEPLWRELYELLCASQKEYKKSADIFISEEELSATREKIQQLMHGKGFKGVYPSFTKTCDFNKIRTADCHGEPFTIFREKDVTLYVECIEEVTLDGTLMIQFLTGTALKKDGLETKDAFSCLFYKRGKLYSNFVTYSNNRDLLDGYSLEEVVEVAVKKAELKRLSKRERGMKSYDRREPLGAYVIMGLLFGFLFTFLFAILGCVMVLIFDGFKGVSTVLKDFPWWQIFVSSGVLFGLAMAIVNRFTSRK